MNLTFQISPHWKLRRNMGKVSTSLRGRRSKGKEKGKGERWENEEGAHERTHQLMCIHKAAVKSLTVKWHPIKNLHRENFTMLECCLQLHHFQKLSWWRVVRSQNTVARKRSNLSTTRVEFVKYVSTKSCVSLFRPSLKKKLFGVVWAVNN